MGVANYAHSSGVNAPERNLLNDSAHQVSPTYECDSHVAMAVNTAGVRAVRVDQFHLPITVAVLTAVCNEQERGRGEGRGGEGRGKGGGGRGTLIYHSSKQHFPWWLMYTVYVF